MTRQAPDGWKFIDWSVPSDKKVWKDTIPEGDVQRSIAWVLKRGGKVKIYG